MRANMPSTDVAFNALWAAGGLADDIEGLSYLSTAEQARLTAYKTAVQSANLAQPKHNAYLELCLKRVLNMRSQ